MTQTGTVTADDYTVVRNDEEQYSIWWVGRELPAGWEEVGVTGTREACLTHIDETWTDMRPRSLRTFMDAAAKENAA